LKQANDELRARLVDWLERSRFARYVQAVSAPNAFDTLFVEVQPNAARDLSNALLRDLPGVEQVTVDRPFAVDLLDGND
jgi:hypothetical protein